MNNRSKLIHRTILIIALFVTVACDFLASVLPHAPVTPTPIKATSTPTDVLSVPTITPSPTPQIPLPAPRLAYRTPGTNQLLALNEPIELVFDQPMDQASVQQAFSIEPKIDGHLSWSNPHTLQFTPSETLSKGASYQVTLDETTRNAEGTAIAAPITFAFETLGIISISEVQPAPGSREVSPDTTVTIVFNRPIVPLTPSDQQDALPAPLSFSPPVSGKGEWLNTTIYRFHPDEGFLPSTKYTAKIAAGLTDTMERVLQKEYAWIFTTTSPRIVGWSPRNNAEHIDPNAAISITFNQPMDHTSVELAASVSINRKEIAGSFNWSGGRRPQDSETLVFVPQQPLPRNAECQVKIAATAHAQESDVQLIQAYTWTFDIVRDPGIIQVSPFDGETDVSPSNDIRLTFASPMQRAAFMDNVVIIPKPTRVYTYWSNADTELRIVFAKEPVTTYRLHLNAQALDKFGQTLEQSLDMRFTTGDLSSYVALKTRGNIGSFDAYTDTVVYANHRNVTQLDVKLYQLPVDTFMLLHGYANYKYRNAFSPSPDTVLRQWTVQLSTPRNISKLTRLDMVDEEDNQLSPGIYYLEVTAPKLLQEDPDKRPAHYTFIRSKTNLVLKQASGEGLVWATDLASGLPQSGLEIMLTADGFGWHGEGHTDQTGVYRYTTSSDTGLWDDYFIFSGEPGDERFAVTFNDWDSGIRPWDFELISDYGKAAYAGYLYTDRPIYRPGQKVYFKGIVRADDDAAYSIPKGVNNLLVLINDPQGKELYRETLPVSDLGTFHGEMILDEQAPLGTYNIQGQGEEWSFYTGTSFRIAEYRAPDFQVDVVADHNAYLGGEKINVSVDTTYYFGGPVANADFSWSVLSSPYTFRYKCPSGTQCPSYSWADGDWWRDYGEGYSQYGRLIAEGQGAVDDQGHSTFQVPGDISDETTSRYFTLEANVTDINAQVVSNRTSVVVHKGEFYAGVAPRGRVVQAGKERVVDLLTVDWESQPVPDIKLDAVLMEHRWYSVREIAENGYAYWTWSVEDIPIYTTTVTTAKDGTAEAAFTPPKSGSYRIQVSGADSYGNEVRSSTYIWVWGGGEARWRQESNNRIDLIVDKDEYQIGDIAEILIPSPYSGTVHALVTIERGHIIDTQVHKLSSNSEILRIPIQEKHAPNIFVSVILVQGSAYASDKLASFKMGEVLLPVSVEEKTLNITLSPDKNMDTGDYYHPRDVARYDILVTDNAGAPVEAELSLRLADLSVLALAHEVGPTLIQRFWSQRGLGVRTSTALAIAMEAYNRELAPRSKGGGGGDGEETFIRTRFADTAFWGPVIRTDATGKAKVEVTLPDNLTTWRMQARGITADTLVGRGEVDILSSLDLLVRPVLPRFFVIGDEARIATIVHNNTDKTLSTVVSLSVQGLEVAGSIEQTIDIPAHDKIKLVWPVKVLNVDEVVVRMEAQTEGTQDYYDGREDRLPVYRYTTPEVVGTAGRISGPELRQEIIQLPGVFDPTQGALSIKLDGSLTAATSDALKYLNHYPYECVEHTVSRFLPNVLTYQALLEMGIDQPELKTKLTLQVRTAAQRLVNEQHYDGGWGWWRSDDSNPYLTAYALQALIEADRAGFAVDLNVMHRAADYLRENMIPVNPVMLSWQANRLAYQLYVLGEYVTSVDDIEPAGELGWAVKLYGNRKQLDQYGKALLAVALGLLEPEEKPRIDTLLSELVGAASFSATGIHWEESEPDYWNMNTDIRTTAIVLWALARHNPQSDLLPNAVRWMMNVRRGGYWESTNTTSWALMSLVTYMRATGELTGDFSYTVSLNGEVLLSETVNEETIDKSEALEIKIVRLLVEESNRLIIERHPADGDQSGEGQLYYTAHLSYYLPVGEVRALDRGIIVARQYMLLDDPEASVDSARVGDVIRVKLTVIAPTDLHYVVVEDPLPAGCEAVDLSLNTTSVVGERPSVHNLTAEEEDFWYRQYGWGWWWFSHSEIRDEKVALFATYLPRGTYEYTYIMRASVPGVFNVIPASASEMYFPEVFGRSDGGKFVVIEAK